MQFRTSPSTTTTTTTVTSTESTTTVEGFKTRSLNPTAEFLRKNAFLYLICLIAVLVIIVYVLQIMRYNRDVDKQITSYFIQLHSHKLRSNFEKELSRQRTGSRNRHRKTLKDYQSLLSNKQDKSTSAPSITQPKSSKPSNSQRKVESSNISSVSNPSALASLTKHNLSKKGSLLKRSYRIWLE